MSCTEIEKQIVLFTELTSAEQTKVTAHLSTCKSCWELFESVSHTNNLVFKASKVNVELEYPFRLTNYIMARIKTEESKRWSLFDIFSLKLEFNYIRYAMATLSLLLIVSFGMEQLASPTINKVAASKQAKKVVLNRKTFQEELSKSKASLNLILANNCKSPFNITKVNEDCFKHRMASK